MGFKTELRNAGLLETMDVQQVRILHDQACLLHTGGRCTCRPEIRKVVEYSRRYEESKK